MKKAALYALVNAFALCIVAMVHDAAAADGLALFSYATALELFVLVAANCGVVIALD